LRLLTINLTFLAQYWASLFFLVEYGNNLLTKLTYYWRNWALHFILRLSCFPLQTELLEGIRRPFLLTRTRQPSSCSCQD
ncbi:hypothetical protein DFS33DRAFT_1456384, partial [Desarmillaria ectypa]